jgi:hypothetical protein
VPSWTRNTVVPVKCIFRPDAEQTIRKGSDNQIDSTRVLEVRIQSPPARSLRTISSQAVDGTPQIPVIIQHAVWLDLRFTLNLVTTDVDYARGAASVADCLRGENQTGGKGGSCIAQQKSRQTCNCGAKTANLARAMRT